MHERLDETEHHGQHASAIWIGFCAFAAIALFFLWEEHRALGVLPYLFLLLCPFIHLFMHRGHGAHGRQR